MSEQNVDAELTALADALSHLKPMPTALDRDALLFRAGQASAPRGWKWPLATAAATLVAIGLGVALLLRPQPAVVDHTVYVEVHVPVPEPRPPQPTPGDTTTPEPSVPVAHEAEPPPHSEYQRMQDHLLRWGFDGLPPAPPAPPVTVTRDSLLRSL